MRATVMYGVHDVRVETIPDARLVGRLMPWLGDTCVYLRQ